MVAPAGVFVLPFFQDKFMRVTSWLKEIYSSEPVPEYEVNNRTVDILYEIMECNEESNKDASLLIEEMKDQATTYEAEVEYWQEILEESLNLPEESLSQEATSDFTDLVESAMTLEVEDVSLTSFYYAINSMTWEMYTTKSENQEMEQKLDILTKKWTSAVAWEKWLDEDIEKSKVFQEAEKAIAETEFEDLEFLMEKSKTVETKIKVAEDELLSRELDQTLAHDVLMKTCEELDAVQKEIEPLRKELEFYNDLPASIPMAQVKLEEVRQDLKALEEEITRDFMIWTLEAV